MSSIKDRLSYGKKHQGGGDGQRDGPQLRFKFPGSHRAKKSYEEDAGPSRDSRQQKAKLGVQAAHFKKPKDLVIPSFAPPRFDARRAREDVGRSASKESRREVRRRSAKEAIDRGLAVTEMKTQHRTINLRSTTKMVCGESSRQKDVKAVRANLTSTELNSGGLKLKESATNQRDPKRGYFEGDEETSMRSGEGAKIKTPSIAQFGEDPFRQTEPELIPADSSFKDARKDLKLSGEGTSRGDLQAKSLQNDRDSSKRSAECTPDIVFIPKHARHEDHTPRRSFLSRDAESSSSGDHCWKKTKPPAEVHEVASRVENG